MPISSGTGILPVPMSRHDKSHGQVSIGDSPRRDARATGVAPIDPSGPANVSWRETTSACSRYVFIETALGLGSTRADSGPRVHDPEVRQPSPNGDACQVHAVRRFEL